MGTAAYGKDGVETWQGVGIKLDVVNGGFGD